MRRPVTSVTHFAANNHASASTLWLYGNVANVFLASTMYLNNDHVHVAQTFSEADCVFAHTQLHDKMNLHPIYLVDDDQDDNEIVKEVWESLGLENELVFFDKGEDLINKLRNDEHVPFIIICDLNLPMMNGFEIRERLYNDPLTRYKTVPFIFWSNSASEAQIKKAYDLAAHGMFIKGSTMEELRNTFIRIVDYWQSSLKPH